jgi:hypothetical protein
VYTGSTAALFSVSGPTKICLECPSHATAKVLHALSTVSSTRFDHSKLVDAFAYPCLEPEDSRPACHAVFVTSWCWGLPSTMAAINAASISMRGVVPGVLFGSLLGSWQDAKPVRICMKGGIGYLGKGKLVWFHYTKSKVDHS